MYGNNQCIITITTNGIDDESTVKDVFGYMIPWFTRRRGVENGKIIINEGELVIEWKYKTLN